MGEDDTGKLRELRETPPDTPLQRARKLEEENAALSRLLAEALQRAPSSPPASTPSIPVRAATGTYRLTKGAMAVLGLLAAIAEVVARLSDIDLTPVKAIARIIFE